MAETTTPVRVAPTVKPDTNPVRRFYPDEVCPGQKDHTIRKISEP